MAQHLLYANASDWENPVLSPGMEGLQSQDQTIFYEAARSGTFLPHQERPRSPKWPPPYGYRVQPGKSRYITYNSYIALLFTGAHFPHQYVHNPRDVS